MNKKGYTLVEVVVSVSIISIASIMLATTFGNIIHFMSKSNNVKNSSDDMFVNFESGFATKADTFKETDSSFISYSITGGEKSVKVSGNLVELTSTLEDGISLRNIETIKYVPLGTTKDYIDLIELSKKVYSKSKMQFKSCINGKCETILDEALYAYYMNGAGAGVSEVFNGSFLSDKTFTRTMYIRICFPWDSDINGEIKPLIYLCEIGNSQIETPTKNNIIKYIFDYETSTWYHNASLAPLTLINLGNFASNDNKLQFNGVDVKSFDELISLIKKSTNTWKYLDKKTDVEKPSEYWKFVK